MGGNAIKLSERLSREEFETYKVELKELFPELTMGFVKAYRNKEDFGDIDVVVRTEPNYNIKKMVLERLNPEEYADNNMFFSFLYKNAQIDFIMMSPDIFESCQSYFAWNDMGNFMGRVARGIGFKYGHDGLCYTLRLGDHYKNDIRLSTDPQKIIEFLGYDYDRFERGFDTEEEIFEYSVSSKYFNAKYFDLDEQAHNHRVRNRKRKMYQKMIQYLAENNLTPKPKLTDEELLEHRNRAVEVFGDSFIKIMEEETVKFEQNLEIKQIYNGRVVADITGIQGKELGEFMKSLSEDIFTREYLVYLLSSPKNTEIIEHIIKRKYKNRIEQKTTQMIDDMLNTVLVMERDKDLTGIEAYIRNFIENLDGDVPPRVCVSVLRTTFRYRDKIPSWDELYERTKTLLIENSLDYRRILRGLE